MSRYPDSAVRSPSYEECGDKAAVCPDRATSNARQCRNTYWCSKLEAVLNDYESNLRGGDRVVGQSSDELRHLKADRGYAQMIPMFTVIQSLVRRDLESAGAFRKEVDYARQLAALATPDDQMRFYKANILAIKSDEKRIAKEEIEILKHAKAHGVILPESLYREVGIQ